MITPDLLSAGDREALARHLPLLLGLVLLVVLWGGPLPARAEGSFAAHMIMHMGVVALAAPLLAFGLLRSVPRLAASVPVRLAVLAAFVEFLLVWGWHAPVLHDAARQSLTLLVLEQGSFLSAGLFVWLTALAGGVGRGGAAGVAGLLVTSMHMTLLGALILLAPRPLYACGNFCSPAAWLTPLEDQQLGGALMLGVGGAAYLVGGLALLAANLRETRA